MRFLTCEPEFQHKQQTKNETYLDEAEIFYLNSTLWMEKNIDHNSSTSSLMAEPTHLVMFNTLYTEMIPYLNKYFYVLCAQFFHSHIVDGRVGNHVYVFCKKTQNRK